MGNFKHQYVTNTKISPKLHVVAAAQQLATALKGKIPARNKSADALTWVSILFVKIASTKNEQAKAEEQRNKLQTHPSARKCTPPRVEKAHPSVEVAAPRVEMAAPRKETTHISKNGNAWTPTSKPNYINQDQEDK